MSTNLSHFPIFGSILLNLRSCCQLLQDLKLGYCKQTDKNEKTDKIDIMIVDNMEEKV